MYQRSVFISQFSYRVLAVLIVHLLFSGITLSQTKSFETAQSEASAGISVVYDEQQYLTKASVTIDSIADNETLKKSLKKFEWSLESWFAVKGIDTKPVRVFLCASTQSKRFVLQSDSNLTLKFDSDDVLLGEGQRTSEFKGKARENVCWEVDKVIVDDFAGATSVSFSVAGITGAFSSESLSKFRAYHRLITVEE
mgnify:CR=1 FL=1